MCQASLPIELRFVLLPGQRHDTIGVPPLIEGVDFGALPGDRAFAVDWLRGELDRRGADGAIPLKSSGKTLIDNDREILGWRQPIENFSSKLMELRAIATRYAKTDISHGACI